MCVILFHLESIVDPLAWKDPLHAGFHQDQSQPGLLNKTALSRLTVRYTTQGILSQ